VLGGSSIKPSSFFPCARCTGLPLFPSLFLGPRLLRYNNRWARPLPFFLFPLNCGRRGPFFHLLPFPDPPCTSSVDRQRHFAPFLPPPLFPRRDSREYPPLPFFFFFRSDLLGLEDDYRPPSPPPPQNCRGRFSHPPSLFFFPPPPRPSPVRHAGGCERIFFHLPIE